MHVYPWISTNILFFETSKSRAYISNELTHKIYWLNGKSSDLWKIIVNSEDIKSVVDYAKKINLNSEIQEFLKQLENEQLIQINEDYKDYKSYSDKVLWTRPEILKKSDDFLIEWTQLSLKDKSFSRLQLDLTYKCNEKCIHCYCDKNLNNVQINFEKIKPIIDDAYNLGLTRIVLTGGECTIADDFLKIAKYIRKKRIELIIFTNGQSLYDNEKLFDEVVNLYPHMIGISLYSMIPEIHEKITQVKGSWEKTVKVIEKFAHLNIPVEVKCFITKYNYNDYKEVSEFAKKNRCQFVFDSSLFINDDNEYVEITTDQYTDFIKYAFDNKLENPNDKAVICDKYLNDIPCQAGHINLAISPDLKAKTCPHNNMILGDLNNISLNELWTNTEKNFPINIWREKRLKDFKDCFTHEYCEYCKFCPARLKTYYSKKQQCLRAKIRMKVAKEYVS